MSDLIAPVAVKELPTLNQDILALLFEIRMELRIQNEILVESLNSRMELDKMRCDPFYNGFPGEANTR